jgi:hypothetical protein
MMQVSWNRSSRWREGQSIRTIEHKAKHRAALDMGHLDRITRRKLLNFRERLAENREAAALSYPDASFDLLEFDRLNQQGTNDASSIKERYRILSLQLKVPAAPI